MTIKKINYKKAGVLYTFGSFFNKGIAFLTVPIFTRLLSMEDYGMVSTYNSWVGIVSVGIGIMLHMGIRQAFIDYPERIDDFHSTVTIFITVISGTASIICILVGVISSASLLLPLLCIVQSYATSIMEDYSMYLMMQYRYKLRTFFMIMPNLVSVIVSVLVIRFAVSDSLYLGRIIPTALITFIFGLVVVIAVLKKSLKFDISLLRYGIAISAPLIMHGIALTVLSQSDRIMITSLIGSDKTGIYSVVYNFSMIATALTTALSGIWSPWFLTKLKSHTNEDFISINRIIKLYVLFMAIVMCGVILVAPEVMKFLASEHYWEGMSIIPPIVLANFVTFVYTFYVGVEHFYKKTGNIAINTMAAAISNIILNLIFIPLFGYEAAAYTTIISYTFSLLLHYIKAKELEPMMSGLSLYIPEVIIIIVVGAIYFVYMGNWIIRWLTASVIGICFIYYLLKRHKDLMIKTK